jgi:hypothetical protein
MFARVTDGQVVDVVARPPRRIGNIFGITPDNAAQYGWYPVTEAKPVLQEGEVYGDPIFTVDGTTVTATYPVEPEPVESTNYRTLETRADQALTDLRTIATSEGSLSNAQLSNAVRVIARVCIALIRLELRRLEGTE